MFERWATFFKFILLLYNNPDKCIYYIAILINVYVCQKPNENNKLIILSNYYYYYFQFNSSIIIIISQRLCRPRQVANPFGSVRIISLTETLQWNFFC